MDQIPASDVKQRFGDMLARAAQGPVGVERHRRLVAVIGPPEWAGQFTPEAQRRAARLAQQQVEARRLMEHQRLGIVLLCAAAPRQRQLLAAARREVDRWAAGRLCSQDYIDRWRAWLALPPRELVPRMCSDDDGWGPAMRQNSPLIAAWAGE